MSNRHISFCVGILVVLAGCSGDDSNGGGGATSSSGDASSDSSTPSGDDMVSTGSDGGSGTDATMTMTGTDATTGAETGSHEAGGGGADGGDSGAASEGGNQSAPDASDGGESTLNEGLRLYYAFEDGTGTKVSDTSGNGFNGTYEDHSDASVAGWTTSGRNGGGLAFSGAQDVLLPSGVLASLNAMTVSVWAKYDVIKPYARIFDWGNGPLGTGDHWTFLTASGLNGVEFDMYGGPNPDGGPGPEEALLSKTQLPTAVWKHLAMTANGSEYHLYIDGFPANEATGVAVVTPAEMEPLAPASWLGHSRFPTDPYLNATLDELRVYDHVLTTSEIDQLAWPQHDYSNWHFDEDTGTTATDSSDNAVGGTLSGGATWAASGRVGSAVDLHGGVWADAGADGPQVNFASDPLAHCSSAFTFSSWIQIHNQQPWARLFDFGTAMTYFVYLAPMGGTGLHFGMASPSGVPFDLEAPNPVPADDAWHHVAVTVDAADNVTLYLDGASVASGSAAKDSGTFVRAGDFTGITDYSLGKSRFQNPYLDGAIDELRISCRALTGDEIKALAHPAPQP
jgi:hypothetical protein